MSGDNAHVIVIFSCSKATKLSRNFLGPRLIWMAGIKCEGSEEALHKCPFAGWGRTAGYCAATAYLVCYW